MTAPLFIQVVSALSIFSLSIFVFLKGRGDIEKKSFALMSFLTSLWVFCGFLIDLQVLRNTNPFLTSKISIAIASFTVFAFVYFSWHFPASGKKRLKNAVMAMLALSSLSAFLALSGAYIKEIEIIGGVARRYFSPPSIFLLIYVALSLCYSLANVVAKYVGLQNNAKRAQTRYLFLGLTVGFIISFIFSLVLPLLGHDKLFYLSKLGPLFFFCVSSFAITKKELMDIRVVIGRGFAYGSILLPINRRG